MANTNAQPTSHTSKKLAELDTVSRTVATSAPLEGGWVVTTERSVRYHRGDSEGRLDEVRIVPKLTTSRRYVVAERMQSGHNMMDLVVGGGVALSGVIPFVWFFHHSPSFLFVPLAWLVAVVVLVTSFSLPLLFRMDNTRFLAEVHNHPTAVWGESSVEVTRRAALALFDRVGCSFVEFPADVVRAFNQLVENNETVMSSRLLKLLEDDLYADDAVDIIYRLATTSNEKAVVAARNAVNELHFVKCQSEERQREAERVEAAQRREVEERMAQAMEVEQRALAAAQPDYVEDFTTLVNKHRLVEKLSLIQPDDLLRKHVVEPPTSKAELPRGRTLNPKFKPGLHRERHTPLDPWLSVPEARDIHGAAQG